MKGLKIVEVEWEDSCTEGGWQRKGIAKEHTVSKCKTAGYLLSKNKERVVISQSMSDTGNVAEQIAIPRKCINSIKEL